MLWIVGLLGKITSPFQMAIGAAVMFGLVMIWNITIDNPSVRREVREQVEQEARQRALDLIKQRREDDEELSNMDSASLCRELGGIWVRESNTCN